MVTRNGVSVPGWPFIVVPIIAAVLFFGVQVGGTLERIKQQHDALIHETCRIEVRLQMDLSPVCEFQQKKINGG